MDDSPIPDGLDPTSVKEFIEGAFEDMGYLGRLIKVRAYCEDRSKLISYCDAAGIVLQNRVSKVGYAEVDYMLVDILTWGQYNEAPSNLMVISKNISEGTELFGVLEDLKLLNYNILVSSLGKDAPADLVCLSTYLFGGGKPVDQSISSHGVSKKLANVAKTGVFWNLDDCEIPDDIDIYQKVKSALANQGCHGQMSIWAYCEEDKEPLPGITLVSVGDETARFKKMLRDILFWALQNPVPYPRTTVPSLMVISNISRNIEFAHVLQRLSSRGYNVLLTVPDEKEYICSVWLYPSLIESRTKFPICTRSDKSLHDIKTGIFWNITGCTFPNDDIHLDELNQNFKLAIENQGHHGEVSIKAYWHGSSGLYHWLHGTITLQNREETELSSLLQDLESKGYNIFVAHAEEAASPVIPPACLEWRLDTLLAGGNPINRTNYSRDVLNMIQNDLSFRRKGCHEANTAVFWDIEDCPIPGGMDPLTFLQNIKLALVNHGCHGNVSIMAYCDKNRSLDDFSLSDTSPITLVPTGNKDARIKKMFTDIFYWALENPQTSSVMVVITKNFPWHVSDLLCDAFESRNYNLLLADPYAVGYVDSVWLSTSLFGGGNPIDLKERKNHRSPIMLSSF
uniref:NYN domain-containing protein n=1 Tax=Brassica campestris TaxID=3711 RepID=M4DDZ9_BRACM